MISYGVVFPIIPKSGTKQNIWTLAVILCVVQVLWRIIGEKGEFCTSSFKMRGLDVSLFNKICLNQHNSRQRKDDLFKAKYMSIVICILEKQEVKIQNSFNGNTNIHYQQIIDTDRDKCNIENAMNDIEKGANIKIVVLMCFIMTRTYTTIQPFRELFMSFKQFLGQHLKVKLIGKVVSIVVIVLKNSRIVGMIKSHNTYQSK